MKYSKDVGTKYHEMAQWPIWHLNSYLLQAQKDLNVLRMIGRDTSHIEQLISVAQAIRTGKQNAKAKPKMARTGSAP